ncbi:PleD family two-component system response regulator [Cryobacterium sp. Hb1]|uniref:response regulator n=1 Tax=Cryobacterium sp. Hb1 TaxID=1259147 RepID=UPI00106AAD2F|nr:response regulator [Cryobacterium sp. Hb1]TFD67538.1 response regulator [Cryobacterium sp. Hb1]
MNSFHPSDNGGTGGPAAFDAASPSLTEAIVSSSITIQSDSTALVVENDPKSAEILRLLLETEGFRVITVASGEEALEIARRIPLSLITLDVNLPGMDGWKFLLKLQDSLGLASAPVIIIDGLTDMGMALSRGAAAVLEKPLQPAELQTSLALLGLRADRPQTRTILVVEDEETVNQDTLDGGPKQGCGRGEWA